MVKHTQIIRQLLPRTCLSMFDHFVRLALKGLNLLVKKISLLGYIKPVITNTIINNVFQHQGHSQSYVQNYVQGYVQN